MQNALTVPNTVVPVPMPTVSVPTITTGLPTAPAPALTLDQVIARVLSTNPAIQLSEQRIRLAQAEVQLGESAGYPHVNLNVADTYYGSPTTAGPGSVQVPAIQAPTTIPTIVDAAQGETFTSGGGTIGGTTTQLSSSSGGTGSSSTATSSSGATVTPVSPSNPGLTPATTNGTGVNGTDGGTTTTGGTGGTGTGTGGAGGLDTRPGQSSAPIDPLLQKYAAALQSQADQAPLTAPSPNAAGGHNNTTTRTWRDAYGGAISLSQLVDVFGLVGTGVSVLRETVEFYQIDLNREMNEEALTTKNTFFAVLNAQNDVASDQEQVANAQATYNDAYARYTAGTVPQFDVISAQTQLANAQAELLVAENELNTQKANLDNLMGLPAGTDFTLTSPPMPPLAPTYNEPNEIATAYANRPEMNQVRLDENIAHKLVRLAQAQYLPTVAIGANVDYEGQTAVAGESAYTEDVTAQVSVPIYQGGEIAAEVRQAKVNEQTEHTTEVQLRQNIALEVEAALLNLQNATSLVQADETSVTASRTSLRLAEISYRAGVGTLLDVENAQAQVATAEVNLSSAEFQLQTAYAALVRAEGGR